MFGETYYCLQQRIFNLYTCCFTEDSDLLYDFTLIVRELSHAKLDDEISSGEYQLLSANLISTYNATLARKILPV